MNITVDSLFATIGRLHIQVDELQKQNAALAEQVKALTPTPSAPASAQAPVPVAQEK